MRQRRPRAGQSRGVGEGERLKRSLVRKRSAHKQFSIIYQTKEENVKGLCLSWAQVNKQAPVSPRERVLLCSELFSRTQTGRERPLNVSFPGAQPQVKFNLVAPGP